MERHALVKIKYHRADGRVVEVIGVDFTDPNQRRIRRARGGYHPLISPEWTGGMIIAYYRLAAYFWSNGNKSKASHYKAKGDALLASIWTMGVEEGGRLKLPYSSASWVKVGHGWFSPAGRDTASSLASNFVGLAAMRFFPSELDGGRRIRAILDQIPPVAQARANLLLNRAVRQRPYEELNQPPKRAIQQEESGGWQPYRYTALAWQALSRGDHQAAIKHAKSVLNDKTWQAQAAEQQRIKQRKGGIYSWPWGQLRDRDLPGWQIIEAHNYSLNHTAAAYWILALAYIRSGQRTKAKAYLKELLRRYNLAQIWDLHAAGFWNPVHSLMDGNAGDLQVLWSEIESELSREGFRSQRPRVISIPRSKTGSMLLPGRRGGDKRGLFRRAFLFPAPVVDIFQRLVGEERGAVLPREQAL